MGVKTVSNEFSSSIPPKRLFKALILESHNLLPKLAPQTIKSVEVVEGNGGAGTIKQVNFPEGSRFKFVKYKIDEIDENNCSCKYSLIDGDMLGDKLETIKYEVKFEASGGGSVCKCISHYHTKGDIELKDEDIQAGKDKALAAYKVVEDHLAANPSEVRFKYLKYKINALDEDNYECNCALIEVDALSYMVESIPYEIKFEASNGGSVCRTIRHCYTKGEIELEDIEAGKDKAIEMYKLEEEYFLANPNIYA